MPQQSQKGRIGSSPSPVMEKVIKNNIDVQKPVPVPGATTAQHEFNKQPCPLGDIKKG